MYSKNFKDAMECFQPTAVSAAGRKEMDSRMQRGEEVEEAEGWGWFPFETRGLF